MLQDRINTGNSNRLLILLNFGIGDLSVVNDHGIATGAATLGPSVLGRELALLVAEEEEAVIVNAVSLTPAGHDVWVVAGEDGDDIHALLLQLWELLDEVWDVVRGAGGGERSWEGEKDYLLVGPLCEVCQLCS